LGIRVGGESHEHKRHMKGRRWPKLWGYRREGTKIGLSRGGHSRLGHSKEQENMKERASRTV
jgi:hypothetical protein